MNKLYSFTHTNYLSNLFSNASITVSEINVRCEDAYFFNNFYYSIYNERNHTITSEQYPDDAELVLFSKKLILEIKDDYVRDFYEMVGRTNPAIVVLPSVKENLEHTKQCIDRWIDADLYTADFALITSKTVGVIEGTSYEELAECYNYIKDKVDYIGFDLYTVDTSLKETYPEHFKNDRYAAGRKAVIDYLINNNILDTNKKHVLVNLGSLDEGSYYSDKPYVEMLFTSLPFLSAVRGNNLQANIIGGYNEVTDLQNDPGVISDEVKEMLLINDQAVKTAFGIEG